MKNTERLFTITKEVLSVCTPTTIRQLVERFGVSENTAKNDLLELEFQGIAYCANPNGKPQLWFAVPRTQSLEMPLELAVTLNLVDQAVQRMLPTEVYRSIEHVFEAARTTYKKKCIANHQSKVVRYERAVCQVDLHKHTALNNIRADVFTTVKSALCSDGEFHFKTSTGNTTVSNISLIELDGQLFIRGISEGRRCHLAASDIIAASEQSPLWQECPRRAS